MKPSKAAYDLIRHFEGCELTAYRDSGGLWTIGYGHTKNVHEGMIINRQTAEMYLTQDVNMAAAHVERAVKVLLTQGQFDALVSFIFNLGAGRLQQSTLLKKLNAGDYGGAAEEFGKWVYANGEKAAGLVSRRAEEKRLFGGIV